MWSKSVRNLSEIKQSPAELLIILRIFAHAVTLIFDLLIFSERSLYVIDGPTVCLSVVCRLSSVTLVHPTQAIEIFGNISTPCGTLAIHDLCIKILSRSSQSQGNPSVGGVKHKRGSQI